jgi:mitochondrial fission protein ELM1
MNFCWRKKNPILNIDLLVSSLINIFLLISMRTRTRGMRTTQVILKNHKRKKKTLYSCRCCPTKNNRGEDDLHHYHQLQGESKKINKKRLLPSSETTKNHFPSRRQKPPQPVKLSTDLVARVSVEKEFLETNPSV